MEATTVYVVLRETADGPEVDVFQDAAKARQWAEALGAPGYPHPVRVENTLDDMLPELLATLDDPEDK